MRDYSYIGKWEKLLTPEVVSLLTQIHEMKGEQNSFIQRKADTLTGLLEIAKIQSVDASNKIEGIYTSDERLKSLVLSKTQPKNRNEQEIAGYRDVLQTIHENYDAIPVKTNIVLQLHRDLYKFSGLSMGGQYKTSDNVIMEEDEAHHQKARFIPVPAWETSESCDNLYRALDEVSKREEADPLLIIPMFILDFLCIHPFHDGNGRMSRLLTLLLLYRAGYTVGKYISVEKLIEKSKEDYYAALQESSQGWHENENDYLPFVGYMLRIIVAAYRDFKSRTKLLGEDGVKKPDRIRELIKEHLGKITKAEIVAKCPDIAEVTVQRALSKMLQDNDIIKIGGGRYTSYIWNHDKGENE